MYKAFLIFLLFVSKLHAVDLGSSEELMSNVFAEGVTVDLREPLYEEGILSTRCGGVITGPNIRIQAQNIVYIRKLIEGEPVFTVVAEGDVFLEYHDYVFAGEKLEYDFQDGRGRVYNGRSAMEPWYFGGELIELCPDGDYVIYNGYITTSEDSKPEWQLGTDVAIINKDKHLWAKNIKFRLVDLPIFWIPTLSANLETIFDAPLKFRIRWGGGQGLRVGAIYEFLTWGRFKAFLRFDYRFNRGPGGGIETEYRSADCREVFLTSNYVARDSSIEDPNERFRYRFEGAYLNRMDDNRFVIDLTYDKLSDREMETDYYEKGLELKTAQKTQLNIRRQQDDYWIGNFFTRVRLNDFQTVKQELPSIDGSFHPLELGSTGIISDNRFEVSYLNFQYSDDSINGRSFDSTRTEFRNKVYRPFTLGYFNHTPSLGAIGIHYGHSPRNASDSHWLALGMFEYALNTHFNKLYWGCFKHTIEPYVNYQYYTFPTINPNEHFIFDIEDGWYRENKLQFGCRNLIYTKRSDGFTTRYLLADLYSYAFFDTPTIFSTIPYVYARIIWDTFPTLRNTLNTAWDCERNEISFFNLKTDLTISENFAISTEYRHRNAFAWRKVDETNFILESFRNENELRHSLLSDRRDTLLLHLFYRFRPNWALEFESRHGWNREIEPAYTEYEVDLLTTFATAWHIKLSYQHKVEDDRFAVYVNVGVRRPEQIMLHSE